VGRASILVLAALVFAVVLIARLPAAWVVPALHTELTCGSVSGSLWNGECTGARVHGVTLDQLVWQLHPQALLRGRLSAHVSAIRGNAAANGELSVGLSGTLDARGLNVHLPLDPALLPMLPAVIRGTLRADITRLELERNGAITRLQGRLTVRHLIDSSGQVTPLGSFTVNFPGGPGEPRGRLHDLGGPLALSGTLRLTAEPGYVLHARLAARADASPSLRQALQYLGAPDAQGRRPFALSGTY
jgi:general secretion pathway protein N